MYLWIHTQNSPMWTTVVIAVFMLLICPVLAKLKWWCGGTDGICCNWNYVKIWLIKHTSWKTSKIKILKIFFFLIFWSYFWPIIRKQKLQQKMVGKHLQSPTEFGSSKVIFGEVLIKCDKTTLFYLLTTLFYLLTIND